MYPVSERFLDAIRVPHNVTFRVDAYRAGALVQADLPIAGGEVQIDATSNVRRQLNLSIADPSLAPKPGDTTGPLTPYGTELFVRRGIVFPEGVIEWVPLGWFRIQTVTSPQPADVIKVVGVDRAKRVADAKFLTPTSSITANTVPAEITRLVQAAIPSQPVTDLTYSSTHPPLLTWEQDRWAAITDLAVSIGAEVFFDPNGTCVLRPVPTIDSPIAWYVDSGVQGVLIQGDRETNRENTYNSVTVTSERTDSAPVQATASDTDPASPTYYNGPFGQVPYFYTNSTITTVPQALLAATALLGRTKGLTRSVDLKAIPNPALDAGDVIQVMFPDGTYERHVVDGLTIPLTPTEAMPIKTRSTDPAKE